MIASVVSLVSTTGVDADLVNPIASIELNEKKANYMIYLFANVLISYFSRTFLFDYIVYSFTGIKI